jgi:ABC-type transport system involved in multi-copper enzyme maturation permease subunit
MPVNLSLAPVLGVMRFDKTPLSFENWNYIYYQIMIYLQDAGGFAMVGLCLWLINSFINPVYDYLPGGKRKNRLISPLMLMGCGAAFSVYLVSLGLLVLSPKQADASQLTTLFSIPMPPIYRLFELSLAGAGLLAMVGFVGPFFVDFMKMRARRIFAIAKLSFKEAVRRRVVYVFLGILLLYLFPARWFFQDKPEDEVKTIVTVTTYGMNLLLVSVGLLLAGFSIPSDIKNLTIYTIVTKPVERFEIVLGRFLGYLGLVTAALVVMTLFGIFIINAGNISDEAAEESLKSRVVSYGYLEFKHKVKGASDGIDVGREDGLRKYIPGHPQSNHRAIWSYYNIPSGFVNAKDSKVAMEFAFDIYRTTKGDENKGVAVSFDVFTHQWDPAKEDEYNRASEGLRNPRPEQAEAWAKANDIAAKFGRFTFRNFEIYDYHTSTLFLPAALFKSAADGTPDAKGSIQQENFPARRMQVQVKCETPSQFIGAARHDLYLLESVGKFWVNYLKGSIGVWCRLTIVIAIGIAVSTYLSGVMSMLTSMFLFIGGFFQEFIGELASGKNQGGGPLESLTRLVKNTTTSAELDQTPTVQAVLLFDNVYRWIVRRVMDVFPDSTRYGMTEYVAQGFNIDIPFLLLNVLFVGAYTLPWLIAAHYLLKAREIAA